MTARTRVAIVPWGDCIEDFLEPLSMTVEDMAEHMTDGWLFGYVDALARHGIDAEIICWSAVHDATTLTHLATGAPIHVLRQPKLHRWLRTRVGDPLGREWLGSSRHRSATVAVKYTATGLRPLRALLRERVIAGVLVQEYELARFDVLALRLRGLDLGVHGVYQGGQGPPLGWERRIRARALRRASSCVTPAASEHDRLNNTYPASASVEIVPNPVDTDTWRATDKDVARHELAIEGSPVIFVCHGRIDIGRKGLDTLLDAWRLHRAQTDLDTRLVLIGSGQDDEQFAELLHGAGLDESVSWEQGYETSRSVMRQWLSAADAYVSASRLEGMPVAPLEAMACGLPLVVTAAPGLTDIVGPNSAFGRRSAVDDAVALAANLTVVAADDQLRHSMGSAARIEAEATYGLDAVGRALAEVLTRARH